MDGIKMYIFIPFLGHKNHPNKGEIQTPPPRIPKNMGYTSNS